MSDDDEIEYNVHNRGRDKDHMKKMTEKAVQARRDNQLREIEKLAKLEAIPKMERKKLKMPYTVKQILTAFDISEPTYYRWRDDDHYKKCLEDEKNLRIMQLDETGVSVLHRAKLDELANADANTYEQVKGSIIDAAVNGDHKAVDLYMRHWGRPFVEQEVNRVDDVADWEDAQLIDGFFEVCQIEALEAALERRREKEIDLTDTKENA